MGQGVWRSVYDEIWDYDVHLVEQHGICQGTVRSEKQYLQRQTAYADGAGCREVRVIKYSVLIVAAETELRSCDMGNTGEL